MRTALYRHFDKTGALLYVGVSLHEIHRLHQHQKNSRWAADIHLVTIEYFESREAALDAERRAIQLERPSHNVTHNNSPHRVLAKSVLRTPRVFAVVDETSWRWDGWYPAKEDAERAQDFFRTIRPNHHFEIYDLECGNIDAWDLGDAYRKMPPTTPEEFFQADVFAQVGA